MKQSRQKMKKMIKTKDICAVIFYSTGAFAAILVFVYLGLKYDYKMIPIGLLYCFIAVICILRTFQIIESNKDEEDE